MHTKEEEKCHIFISMVLLSTLIGLRTTTTQQQSP